MVRIAVFVKGPSLLLYIIIIGILVTVYNEDRYNCIVVVTFILEHRHNSSLISSRCKFLCHS